MTEITIRCGCTRAMQPEALRGPGHYRCGCGARVKLSGLPTDDAGRCPIRRDGRVCNGPKLRDSLACEPCSMRISMETLAAPELRARLATGEIDRAWREARDAAAEERAEASAAEQARLRIQRSMRDYNVVYYCRVRPGVIKIGTTRHLRSRMTALRVPDEHVLAAEPGTMLLENVRHRQFAQLRTGQYREDFEEGPELMAHIAAVVAEHGQAYDLATRIMLRQQELAKMATQS